MANPDRLTGLDSSFLHLERDSAHMHVAGCMVFEGKAPTYPELVDQIGLRLHLVPRYRQRLAFVPFDQGRPVWVDDPHFNLTYHVRHTALPRPGGDHELKRLAGRIFSQALDRNRPLWELWLVEGLADDRFAMLSQDPSRARRRDLRRRHRDGPVRLLAGSDAGRPARAASGSRGRCRARRSCSPMRCSSARRRRPRSSAASARRLRGPRHVAQRVGEGLVGVGAMAWAGLNAAPPSPFNVRIGPHRRFTWVRGRPRRSSRPSRTRSAGPSTTWS